MKKVLFCLVGTVGICSGLFARKVLSCYRAKRVELKYREHELNTLEAEGGIILD